MSGCRSGIAKKITDIESRALYTHCYGHSLNLAVGDTVKTIKPLQDIMDIAYEISGLIKLSPKRDNKFDLIKKELAPDTPGFRVLCPTRWTVRANSLKSILDNYTVLLMLWDECLEEHLQSDIRARIIGVQAQMNFLFGLSLCYLILKHSDNLSCALQGTKISAAEGQATASKTVKTIESLRTDEMYRLFWGKVCQTASEFEIGDPSLPRRRKRPARYEEGLSSPHFSETPQSHYRQLYYECIDSIVNCIRKRFDQPGYKTYQQMEQLLLKAVHGENYSSELAAVIEVYKDDLDATRLEIQLDTLRSSLVEDGISMDIHDILKYMKSLSASDKCLLCEVVTLATLILVMPATNALSERSFSQLRRIKTYLRSTMSQVRLNHCMILNAYQEEVDDINLIDIAKEFVWNEHRENIFGTFM